MAGRQGRGGVGDVAQVRKVVGRQIHLQQDGEDGRHAGETGYPFGGHFLQRRGGEGETAFQHQRPAENCHHQPLVQPVIEGKRQGVENDVVGAIAQVLDDGLRRKDRVIVPFHHPFGVAGGAGGVHQAGQIQVNVDVRGARCRIFLLDGLPAQGADSLWGGWRFPGSQYQRLGEYRSRVHPQGFLRLAALPSPRDEGLRPAIPQDVGQFARFGGVVDHHEDPAGFQHPKDARRQFHAVGQIEHDTVAALQTVLPQGVRQPVGLGFHLGVG